MANSYFRFKQFTVHQQNAAMKVCTDSCLFGAWVASKSEESKLSPSYALDIGAGTGLLSLMLAQKTSAAIDAIEIDSHAALQAQQNFQESPWKHRLQAICGDVRNMSERKKYDLIISNPPFFENDLKATTNEKNRALHSSDLNFEELVSAAKKMLSSNGFFAVLLPYHRSGSFIEMASGQGFQLHEQCFVKQTEKHDCFRCMAFFGTQKVRVFSSELIIKKDGRYSPEFARLLNDYYLIL